MDEGQMNLKEYRVYPITQQNLIRQLVGQWHRTHPRCPAGWRIGFVIWSPAGVPVAVATWGRPVARNEDQLTTLELTRYALVSDAPRNLATWGMARMREHIKILLPEIKRLISYSCQEQLGTIYKADNWQLTYQMERISHRWTNRPNRIYFGLVKRAKWERGL